MFFSTAIFASLYASLAAAATTHTVKVGDGGLKFNPASLDAAAGDMVTFVFLAKNQYVPTQPSQAMGVR
jgi:plastocyanin